MSNQEGESEQDNRLEPDAAVEPLGYYLGVYFHPPIKLAKQAGLKFAASIAEYIDAEHIDLESSFWKIVFGKSDLSISITASKLEFHCNNPSREMEYYERAYTRILKSFEEAFSPTLILSSKAMIRGLIPVNGDARRFLLDNIVLLDESRLDALRRPVHLLGLRLLLPPYEQEADGGPDKDPDCHIDAKIESWALDPSQVFVEVDVEWPSPEEWSEDCFEKVVGRLVFVDKFLKESVMQFLRPSQEGDAL